MEFSILMPVYNAQEYLAESAASVLSQSFEDFELILADDGSTDSSPTLCDELFSAHPDHVRVLHLEHRGLIATRRSAIAAARGDMILWLDSDDLLEEGALTALHHLWESHPGADLILYEFTAFFEDGRPDDKRPALFEDESVFSGEEAKKPLYEMLIRGGQLNAIWAKAVRRDLFQNDPIDYAPYYANPFGEDAIQSLYPLTHADTILYTTQAFCRYRIRQDSIMHKFDPAGLDKRCNEGKLRFFKPFMKEWGLWDREHYLLLKASLYRGVLDGILYFMMEDGYDQKAVRAYAKSFIREHPDMKRLSHYGFIPFKERVIFALFSNGQFGLLKTAVRIRQNRKQG